MAIVVPRLDAVRVLTRVFSDHQPLDEALGEIGASLSSEEFAWLQEVCSGTVRWRGILDGILNSVALKKKPSGWLRKVLLIATYQLVVQDRAPIAAVVNETVNWVKKKDGEAPARFANACLRKISDHREGWDIRSAPNLEASLPAWMWQRLVKEKGKPWALKYAEASLDRPQLWLRARSHGNVVSEPSEGLEVGPITESWELTQGGRVTRVPGFQEGKLLVQDISSQYLIAEITQAVGDVRVQGTPFQVLDLCAAPGGKSVGLAWSGFEVTASDKNAQRVPLLRETLARAAPAVRVVDWAELQGTSVWPFKMIWVDAPCSGTGILRRHPEIRWSRKEGELESLKKAQTEILTAAWERLTPGGYLVYSVCSVLEEEGPQALTRANLAASGVEIKRWSLCPQDFPHGDGFWGVLFQKNLV